MQMNNSKCGTLLVAVALTFGAAACGAEPGEARDTGSAAQKLGTWTDATHGEIIDSGWPFDDTNVVGWAQARRAANEISRKHGFVGGFFNGHQLDGKYGLVGLQAGATWMDATRGQIVDSGWPFDDTNVVGWAQAARAANGICTKQGFVGGFFNGHQASGKYGLVCVGAGAKWMDATRGQIVDSGWPFDDTNVVGWAQAARAANGICTKQGFVGGFFNGHQLDGKYGLVCVQE